jgi:outer membrane protein insertion porin family
MVTLPRVLTVVLLLAAPFSACAQSASAGSAPGQQVAHAPDIPTPIDRITFRGAGDYSDTELLRVVGLHTGEAATQPMLNAAVQSLFDTGLFADVGADFDFNDGVHTLTFKLKPIPDDQLLHVSFANLIWFTPEEIETAMHRAIPLYHDRIADQGKPAAQIQAVLNHMLTLRHVQATLGHDVVAATRQHPYRAVEFKVIDPPIRVAGVNVVGGPGLLVNAEVAAQKQAAAAPYNEGSAGVTIQDILLAPLFDAGYIGAKLTDVKLQRITSPTQIGIVYNARIESGPLYKVGTVAWSPGPGYTQEDFARDCELHPGTIPREAALTETRKSILAAFHKQGYVNADLLVKTDLDDKAGTVNYIFAVNTGEFYKLNKITTVGLTPLAKKEFDDHFALKPGQPFNEDYVTNFLVNNPSLKALSGYGFNYQTDSNPDTHTIDLTLSFTRAQ